MEPLEEQRKDWRSLIALSISALGMLYFLVQAISLSGLLLISVIGSQINTSEHVIFGLLIWYSLLSGVLLAPIFLLGLCDYREKPIPAWLETDRPGFQKRLMWSILVLPGIIVVGWLVAGQPNLSVFVLGLINILVAGIPVLWFYTIGQRGFVEILALLILAGFGGLWIAYRTTINPHLKAELMFLVNQILLHEGDLESIYKLIEPYFLQPSVFFWGFAIFSGIIPLIEEIMKPIALWSLAGRKISPQEGFVGGLLCGAGFAIMENLLYFQIVVTSEEWLFVSLGRIGTAVLHMLASGLIGWGLARTWCEGKWLLLIATTLGSFFLHGIWNAFALFSGVFHLFTGNLETTPWQTLLFNLPLILLFLAAGMSIFLINQYFRKGTGLKDSNQH